MTAAAISAAQPSGRQDGLLDEIRAGLPLKVVLQRMQAQGLSPEVVFTSALRRRLNADEAEEQGYTARVLRRDGDTLICAWFNEPEIALQEGNE